MDEKRQSILNEMLKMRKEVVDEKEYTDIRDRYKMDEIDSKFTERRHRIITGEAVKLANLVIKNGGTKDEVKKAIINLMICMDSMKYKLDWARWKRDNNMCLLIRKYQGED